MTSPYAGQHKIEDEEYYHENPYGYIEGEDVIFINIITNSHLKDIIKKII